MALPWDLLHIDVKTYSRFEKPGHALTGDRTRVGKQGRKHLGQDYAHAAVDDHSRLAFSELYPDERAGSVVAFMEGALAFYRSKGITIRRILTDNAWSYTHNRALAELLDRGRQEETLELPGLDGARIAIHPNHFQETLEERPEVARYQVLHTPQQITVSVVARNDHDPRWTNELAIVLTARLHTLGANPPPITVNLVEDPERPATPGAKLKVIRSEANRLAN